MAALVALLAVRLGDEVVPRLAPLTETGVGWTLDTVADRTGSARSVLRGKASVHTPRAIRSCVVALSAVRERPALHALALDGVPRVGAPHTLRSVALLAVWVA